LKVNILGLSPMCNSCAGRIQIAAAAETSRDQPRTVNMDTLADHLVRGRSSTLN
jgi:hypothetical protein